VARQRKDAFGVVLECDEATTAVLGWSPDEMIGKRSLDFIHPADADRVVENWMELIGAPGGVSACRVRYLRRDGSYVPVEIVNHNRLVPDGHVLGEITSLDDESSLVPGCAERDVHSEAQVSETVARVFREQQQLVRRLTEGLPNGVAQVDGDGRVVHVNSLAGKLLGTPDARDTAELFAAVARKDRRRLENGLGAASRGSDRDLEVTVVGAHGSLLLLLNMRALFDEVGQPAGAIICVSDVTEANRMRAELERRATVDSLTACANRATIIERLSAALGRGDGVAAIYVDVDHFKSVNDRHGHAAGDELLAVVAARLRGAARSGDIVGRLGGDEFLVVCPGVPNAGTALALAERVTHAAEGPLTLPDGTVAIVRVSVGAAHATGPSTADELVQAADVAMYCAKRGLCPSPNLAAAPVAR
jgi:diguanylate cyclase (GGDEF)-like protein/PAS domain S-box-containing protein